VLSLNEDDDKNIWIATAVGLSCYRKNEKKFISTGLPASIYGASNIVRKVIADSHHRLWCATDGGLFLCSLPTKTWTSYFNTTPGEKPTAINKIVDALLDKSGNIWLCTFDGLWVFDTQAL